MLREEVFRRKAAEETNRKIAVSFGLTKKQITRLVTCQNRKAKLIANGYIPRPKGRPRKAATTEEERCNNELNALRMQVELLRNGGTKEANFTISKAAGAIEITCADFAYAPNVIPSPTVTKR